jgi:hypothetical protein
MRAVLRLPIEQRTALLRRIALRLPVCVSRFSNIDFDKAVRVALRLCFQLPGRRGLSKNGRYALS